jgi:MOSC domain-containing protein YiiM
MTSAQGTVVSVSRNEVYSFTKPVRDEIVLVAGIGIEGDVHAGVHVRHRGRVRADPTQPNLRQVHLIHEELFAEVGAKGFAVAPGELGENVTTSGIDLLGLPVGTILRFGPPRGETAAAGHNGAGTAGGGADGPGAAGGGADGPGAAGGAGVDGAPGAGGGVSGAGAVAAVLAAAARAVLDPPTAAAARALEAAAARDTGDDPRPAVIVAGLRNPCAQINDFQSGLLKEVIGKDGDGNLVRKGGVMAVVLRGGAIRAGHVVGVELPPPPYAPLDRV